MYLKIKHICLISIFSALICIGAFIKIPLPYIPFTLQVLFVNLAALMLGAKLGAFSVLIYIILGLLGLPVFANGGGFNYILNPTFGYIIGFLFGCFLAGFIAEKDKNLSYKLMLIASFVNLTVIYFFGLLYYFFINKFVLKINFAFSAILLHGFVLTLPGDVISCIVSCVLTKKLKKIL